MSSLRVMRRATAARLRLGVGLPLLLGWVLIAAPQAGGAVLPAGAEIDVTDCAYGPGQVLAGHESGQYFSDTEGFYALTFLPANASGGHFRFRAKFPRARWMSYQAFDQTLATQGVLDDVDIDPDAGSVNPFLPGQHYESGHVSYKVDVRNVPPSQRQHPSPPSVLYGGYRMNPSIGGLFHTPNQLVLYSTELATGPGQQGGVPLPRLFWVVDSPEQNQFRTQAQLCAALQVAAQPWAPLFRLNATLDKYLWSPALVPSLKNVDLPNPLDPIPQNPPGVSVFRPSSNGYSLPLFNQQSPYIVSGPSALFGRFIVIRFKAPTFPRTEQGVPSRGDEQTRYWSWCAGQILAPITVTTGCMPDVDAHTDDGGYVTLVVSPGSQRPTIDGRPYSNWLEWPGGGATIFMAQIVPNPRTFPQSPYFLPPTAGDLVPYIGDWLPGLVHKSYLKAWMGPYYPQVSYCSRIRFESHRCAAMPTP